MNHLVIEAPAQRLSRAQMISAMARRIHDPQLSTGALASLRRGSRHDVARQAAFHRVLSDVPENHLRPEDLPRWAAVAQCIALTGIPTRPDTHDGSVLALAGLSESRFARLLASHGDGLFDQLLLAARYLHSKDAPVSWAQLGELALVDEVNEGWADVLRLRLARDFYRTTTAHSAA